MVTTSPPTAVALLERALEHLGEALRGAGTTPGSVPTPCAGWDLTALLLHVEESLCALADAARTGHVEVDGHDALPACDRLAERVARQAVATREAWVARVTSAPVGVDDLRLDRETLLEVGALEVAVHGWDVGRATGAGPALPEDLADDLLAVALREVTRQERGRRFGPAYVVPPSAPASARLLAHLGRH